MKFQSILICVVSIVGLVQCTKNSKAQVKVTEDLDDDDILNMKTQFEEYHDHANKVHTYYGIDPEETKKLAILEEKLAKVLGNISDSLSPHEGDQCALYLLNYLEEYNEDNNLLLGKTGEERAEKLAHNPILTLKMLRRIAVDLLNDTIELCRTKDSVVKALEGAFKTANIDPPTDYITEDAVHAIFTLQLIYDLNGTDHVRLGNLHSQEPATNLGVFNFDDCLYLATKAYLQGIIAMAYQWVVAAEISKMKPGLKDRNMKKLAEVWRRVLNIGGWRTKQEAHKELRGKRQQGFPSSRAQKPKSYETLAICRGEQERSFPQRPSGLTCLQSGKASPYFRINPLRVETIHEHPYAYVFHDFLTDKEIEVLKREPSVPENVGIGLPPGLQRNKLLNAAMELNQDPVIRKLLWKIEQISRLKISMDAQTGHIFQREMYTPLSSFENIEKLRKKPNALNTGKNAIRYGFATWLMFLSDTPLGGYHVFQHLGMHVESVKGAALFWLNYDSQGVYEELLEDHTCPVILGTKQVVSVPLILPGYKKPNFFKKA